MTRARLSLSLSHTHTHRHTHCLLWYKFVAEIRHSSKGSLINVHVHPRPINRASVSQHCLVRDVRQAAINYISAIKVPTSDLAWPARPPRSPDFLRLAALTVFAQKKKHKQTTRAKEHDPWRGRAATTSGFSESPRTLKCFLRTERLERTGERRRHETNAPLLLLLLLPSSSTKGEQNCSSTDRHGSERAPENSYLLRCEYGSLLSILRVRLASVSYSRCRSASQRIPLPGSPAELCCEAGGSTRGPSEGGAAAKTGLLPMTTVGPWIKLQHDHDETQLPSHTGGGGGQAAMLQCWNLKKKSDPKKKLRLKNKKNTLSRPFLSPPPKPILKNSPYKAC